MQLALAALDKFDAKLIEHRDGAFTVIGASGNQYGIFPKPVDEAVFAGRAEGSATAPDKATQFAIRSLVELDHAIVKINADQRLSDLGRSERLEQPRDSALKSLLATHVSLDENAQGLTAQEAQRYTFPAMDRADIVGALQDTEVRNWVRSLSGKAREEVFRTVSMGEDSALVRAILRSPVNLGNLELAARTGWKERIDRDDPVGRALLNTARKSIEWGERNLAVVQAHMIPRLKYSRPQIFERVGDRGARFFGFAPEEIAAITRQRVAAKFAAA